MTVTHYCCDCHREFLDKNENVFHCMIHNSTRCYNCDVAVGRRARNNLKELCEKSGAAISQPYHLKHHLKQDLLDVIEKYSALDVYYVLGVLHTIIADISK